jgi:hypothetical protein
MGLRVLNKFLLRGPNMNNNQPPCQRGFPRFKIRGFPRIKYVVFHVDWNWRPGEIPACFLYN